MARRKHETDEDRQWGFTPRSDPPRPAPSPIEPVKAPEGAPKREDAFAHDGERVDAEPSSRATPLP
jgi:hypothetical protein